MTTPVVVPLPRPALPEPPPRPLIYFGRHSRLGRWIRRVK